MATNSNKLFEIAEVIDSLHKTPQYTQEGFPMIRVTDIKYGQLLLDSAFKVDEETFLEFSRRYKPTKNDIIITRVGSYGISAWVIDEKFCLGQNTAAIVPNINPRYLYIALNSPQVKNQIHSFAVGSTQKTLSLNAINNLDIPRFTAKTEDVIASILGTLDDKIELNRRTNATLETIAQILFKSWFVDFDPVKAKAAGLEPEGLDAQTAALFPSGFENSSLGEIPEGWRVGTLGEVMTSPRRTIDPTRIDPETPYIGLEHMPRGSIALTEWGNASEVESNKLEFFKDEILFGKLRPYFRKVGVAPIDGVASSDIIVISSEKDWFGFVLSHVSSEEFINYANGASTGTRMPRANWADMKKYPVVIPPVELASRFSDFMREIVDKMHVSTTETQSLTITRDSLLPKLLSGELDVSDFDLLEQSV